MYVELGCDEGFNELAWFYWFRASFLFWFVGCDTIEKKKKKKKNGLVFSSLFGLLPISIASRMLISLAISFSLVQFYYAVVNIIIISSCLVISTEIE